MIKVTVIKHPATRYCTPSWSFHCPLCRWSLWPNLLKDYAKGEVRNHMCGVHRIDLDRIKLRVKKQKNYTRR